MVPAPINPDPSSTLEWEHMQKQLDRDIREMVSALMNRLAQLQQNPDHVQKRQPDGSSHLHQHLDHENTDMTHGVRIVTLGGSNTGAFMRGELDDNNARAHGTHDSTLGHGGPLSQINDDEDDDGSGTYVNSNFQAINNSIMLAGSYSANDPGVHLDISDFLEYPSHAGKSKHHKKEKEISRSDHHNSEPLSE